VTARILDGRAVSAAIRSEVAERVRALSDRGVVPGLAAVLVGDDPASRIYVGSKHKACADVGIRSEQVDLPAYVTATSGAQQALGTSQLVFCLPPPDIPPAAGGATFGAKFLTADLTLRGVIGPVLQGAWVGFWLPWQPGNGQPNPAAAVASPAAIAPGGITLTGRKVRGVKRLAGRVTQGGAGVATRVSVYGAVGRAVLRRIAVVSAKANGTFTYAVPKRSRATTFQARVAVPARASAAVCPRFATLPVPCVNGTLSGFGARSRSVPIR